LLLTEKGRNLSERLIGRVICICIKKFQIIRRKFMPEYNGDSRNNDISGSGRADVIRGSGGNDTLSGGGGNDTLFGGNGNDLLRGGIGNDALNGGYGDDRLIGASGVNTYVGGPGADIFVFYTNTVETGRIFDFKPGEGDLIEIDGTRYGAGSFLDLGTSRLDVITNGNGLTFAIDYFPSSISDSTLIASSDIF
jgi:Ca2+-binding RTX toxin-like protein